MRIIQIVLAGSIIFFTWLLLRSGMTTGRFVVVSLVWLCAGFLVLAESRLEIFKVILQSAGVLLAFAAFAISILTFSLQQTPLLALQGFNIVEGEHGVLFFDGKYFSALPAYPLESVFDPTGAGDTFAGGFMGYVAKTGDTGFGNLKKAVAYESIMASFVVEDFGLDRMRRLTPAEIDARLKNFKTFSTF